MIIIKRFIGIAAIATALITSGCANVTAKQLPTIAGTDTSTVTLLINNDYGSAVLSGNVSRFIDSKTIEEFVRNEYGYKVISNLITVE